MEKVEENVCCPLLRLAPCAETREHQHIICRTKDGTTDNPILDNEHVKKYCIGDTQVFNKCPYYPRYG